jgi:hypothetical protein
MLTEKLSVGFIYVLTNESMPNLVKVGLTSHLPEDRAKQLFSTAIPSPFIVAFRQITSHPRAVEKKAHELLSEFRVNKNREFFETTVEVAIEKVRLAAIETSGITQWDSPKIHKLQNGDRVALTLEKGQVFALTAYEKIFSETAEMLDLWQSHSHGDILEIYATNEAGSVASFSENDPNDDDPVPYLNRDGNISNGMMNGREKLVPGDRLTWVPSYESRTFQNSVVFEADCYIQIISRTWSPSIEEHGFPLLLNDFLYDSTWPEAHESVYHSLHLPLPRSWAPRVGISEEWGEFGNNPQDPDYWLPQLKVKKRKSKA